MCVYWYGDRIVSKSVSVVLTPAASINGVCSNSENASYQLLSFPPYTFLHVFFLSHCLVCLQPGVKARAKRCAFFFYMTRTVEICTGQ